VWVSMKLIRFFAFIRYWRSGVQRDSSVSVRVLVLDLFILKIKYIDVGYVHTKLYIIQITIMIINVNLLGI
jgi:hypothetical protein